MQDKAFSSVSNGRWESSLSASAEAKPSEKQEKARKAFFLAIHRICITCGKSHLLQEVGPRRGPGGERKAPWSPPQRRNPLRNRKSKEALFPLLSTGNASLVESSIYFKRWAPEGVQGATGKPPGRLRRGETLHKTGKARKHLSLASHKKPVPCGRFRPPAGGRGTFHHWKVPKGCRGRPKGACLMAAPGPPVAKEQCTASLAGARPAGFTSVPGRATVAFKVGFHFVKAKSLRDPRIRLWRKRGLAQLIPPPAPGRRSIPGVMARSHHGSATL